MYLPYDDNLKIGELSRVFDRNRISNCYKFFWFLAILEKVKADKYVFTYDELITEMIADAWYMVNEFKLRLGPANTKDNLEEVAKYLYECLYKKEVPTTIAKEKMLARLKDEQDKTYLAYKANLIINVPYCMQSPFYPEIKNPGKDKIHEINQAKRLLYVFSEFDKLKTTIRINEEWVSYLIRNNEILKDWTRYNLIRYLQDRNPHVPGIADKIMPQQTRDLGRVKTFWERVITVDPSLQDIYAGEKISEIKISIDHFVPWQYVSHDELWNLSPTTKSINSKKSNNLAAWKVYFDKLCDLEFKANELRFTNVKVAEAFTKCLNHHVNNTEVFIDLYRDRLDYTEFRNRLSNVLEPVYMSAKNCGFREGEYDRKKDEYLLYSDSERKYVS
jgi:hypothetical protein